MPGIARQMSDDPNNIHVVAGSSYLGMHRAMSQQGEAAVLDFVDIITHAAKTKTLRAVHTVIVNLRLRMLMRRIPAPLARPRISLTQHQIGIRGCHIIEQCCDRAFTGVVTNISTGNYTVNFLSTIKSGRKGFLILRRDHENLAGRDAVSFTRVFRGTCRPQTCLPLSKQLSRFPAAASSFQQKVTAPSINRKAISSSGSRKTRSSPAPK